MNIYSATNEIGEKLKYNDVVNKCVDGSRLFVNSHMTRVKVDIENGGVTFKPKISFIALLKFG